METAIFFFLAVFVFFFLALGGVLVAARAAEARAAAARAQAAELAKKHQLTPVTVISGPRARGSGSAIRHRPSNSSRSGMTGESKSAPPPAQDAHTGRSKLYWDFWELFLSRVGTEQPEWATGKASKSKSRYDLPTGRSGIVYSTAFTQQGLTVQLYFSSPDASINQNRFEALRARKEQFEQALGEAANWDDKPGKKAAAISVTSQFDNVADVDLWPAMLDWVLDQHARFRQAIAAIGGLKIIEESGESGHAKRR